MVGGSLPASSTTKTGHHDIAEILLKVALNTKKSNHINQSHEAFSCNNVLLTSIFVGLYACIIIFPGFYRIWINRAIFRH
jgi:hypothetical protein